MEIVVEWIGSHMSWVGDGIEVAVEVEIDWRLGLATRIGDLESD